VAVIQTWYAISTAAANHTARIDRVKKVAAETVLMTTQRGRIRVFLHRWNILAHVRGLCAVETW
jgi:hypothetical protein